MIAYDLGYEYGLENNYQNPYPYESIDYALFDSGYIDAQTDNKEKLEISIKETYE